MSTLPDLDTSNISFIAFWNAINDGEVSSIDPEEALSDGSIEEYTLYDNGWEGLYSLSNRVITVRVKSDGWFVAYIDRTDNYAQDRDMSITAVSGHYDVLNGLNSSLDNNGLESSIESLQAELSVGTFFQATDVGLYYYPAPATNITRLYSYDGSSGGTHGFLYSSADLHYAVAMGHADATYKNNGLISEVDFEGTTIAISSDFNDGYGVLDISGMVSPETEYSINVSPDQGNYASNWAEVLLVWSPV